MKQFILFESEEDHRQLLPFTYTRSIANIRVGIHTIKEQWEFLLQQKVHLLTLPYLQPLYGNPQAASDCVFIHASIIPDENWHQKIVSLQRNEKIEDHSGILAYHTEGMIYPKSISQDPTFHLISPPAKTLRIRFPWDIFAFNDQAIRNEFELRTRNRYSQPLSSSNTLVGSADQLFIEEGATVEASVINTKTGPVYIAKDAEVMEGCLLRGPVALGEHSVFKMGSKVYGATTLGPHCKTGGELNNVVLFGYSNKAHDGFLGNSVIGEWCNLGADTNNSNLKNNYGMVDVFSYAYGKQIETGLQFCGLLMADHAKSGINTMFNTGTVVGVSANVFGGDFPPKFIPSFSWGGAAWLRTFSFEKSIEVAERMMERRGLSLSVEEKQVLKFIFDEDAKYRKS